MIIHLRVNYISVHFCGVLGFGLHVVGLSGFHATATNESVLSDVCYV